MKLSQADFAKLVEQAMAGIPERFAEYLGELVVDIEPMPGRRDCQEAGIDDPQNLLGLYVGIPLTERGTEIHPMLPDRIVIYQRNIERTCRTKEEIVNEVRATVLHEIGHYFGLDEDELEDLGYG